MAMDAGEIERLIKARIPDAQVTIRDLAGDGDHYAATVISASFKGKSRVQQHQLVYEALKAQMGGVLHALALQTGDARGLMPSGGVKILSPAGRHHADRHLEPRRARRRFRLRRRHARHRPGDQRAGRRPRKQRIRQSIHEHDGRSPSSEGASLANCVRLTVFVTDMARAAPAGEQGAGGTLGRRALSAAHHRRGRQAQPGRHFRGGRHVLRPENSRDLRPIPSWGGGRICATYIADERFARWAPLKRTEISWASSNSSTMK